MSKNSSIQWLYFVCSMWYQCKNDHIILLSHGDGIQIIVWVMTIYSKSNKNGLADPTCFKNEPFFKQYHVVAYIHQ